MTRIRTLVHYTNSPALAGGCLVLAGLSLFVDEMTEVHTLSLNIFRIAV